MLEKKEDIEKVKEAIKILNIVESDDKQIKHAIAHLGIALPKEKEE